MTNKNNTSFFDRFWDNKPVRWSLLGILLPVSGVMTAYAVTEPMPRDSGLKVERVLEELPSVYVETGSFQSSYWAQEAVQTGDSLADVLTRMGVAEAEIKQIMAKNNPERNMNQLRAGQSVSIRVNASGQVTDVQFFTDEELERNLVALEKVNGKWQASTSEVDMKTMPTLRSVIVRTSARGAMAQAEIPVEIRESLSEIIITAKVKATKKAAATTTKTANHCNRKKGSISSRSSTRVFPHRTVTASILFCTPCVCTPVSIMPRRKVRRLRRRRTAWWFSKAGRAATAIR